MKKDTQQKTDEGGGWHWPVQDPGLDGGPISDYSVPPPSAGKLPHGWQLRPGAMECQHARREGIWAGWGDWATHTYTHTCIPTVGRRPQHHHQSNHRHRLCPIVQTCRAPPDLPWGSRLPPALSAHLNNRSTVNPKAVVQLGTLVSQQSWSGRWIRLRNWACLLMFHSQNDKHEYLCAFMHAIICVRWRELPLTEDTFSR